MFMELKSLLHLTPKSHDDYNQRDSPETKYKRQDGN